MPVQDLLVIKSRVTRGEYQAVAKPLRGKFRLVYLVSFSTFLILIAAMTVAPYPFQPSSIFVALSASVLGTIGCYIAVAQARVVALFAGQLNGAVEVVYRISPGGVSSSIGTATTFIAWEAVRGVNEDALAFVLKTATTSTYIFKKGIGEPDTIAETSRILRQLWRGVTMLPASSEGPLTIDARDAAAEPNGADMQDAAVWPPPLLPEPEHPYAGRRVTTISSTQLIDEDNAISIQRLPSYYIPVVAVVCQLVFSLASRGKANQFNQFYEILAAACCLVFIAYLVEGMWFGRLDIDRLTGSIRRNGRHFVDISDISRINVAKFWGSWNVVLEMTNGRRLRILSTGSFNYPAEARRCAEILSDFLGPKRRAQ